jgi:hypothetical protein
MTRMNFTATSITTADTDIVLPISSVNLIKGENSNYSFSGGKLTIKKSGYYKIWGKIINKDYNGKYITLRIKKNGNILESCRIYIGVSSQHNAALFEPFYFSSGDVISFTIASDSTEQASTEFSFLILEEV